MARLPRVIDLKRYIDVDPAIDERLWDFHCRHLIKTRRLEIRMSIESVAKKVGVSSETVFSIENGTRVLTERNALMLGRAVKLKDDAVIDEYIKDVKARFALAGRKDK